MTKTEERLKFIGDRVTGWLLLALISLAIWVYTMGNGQTIKTLEKLDGSVDRLAIQVAVLQEKVGRLESGP